MAETTGRTATPVGAGVGATHRSLRAVHLPALDGLRAVAVIGVLLYHFGVPHSAGGFLGVDLFFVLSGYLITGQLMTRWVYGAPVGAASFRTFWAARARRLFPSLGAMLAVTTAVVAVGDRVQLPEYRGDLSAAATYTSNWWYVFHHRSYFVATGRPPLLQHLWSLAVEEQFYLVWPVVVLLVTLVVHKRWARKGVLLLVTVGLTAVSALVMGVGSALAQVPQLGDPSRWYFGSDSHAIGLLVGSTLAIARGGDGLGERRHTTPRHADRWSTAVGFAALAAVLALLSEAAEYSTRLYRFGFLLFSVLVAVVIAVAVQHGPLERVLGVPLLRAIGRRSYSIYLWHWPIACMTRPGLDLPWPDWQVFLLRVALTLALTEATYRLIESPVRRNGWPALWHRLREWRVGPARGSALAQAFGLVLVAAICAPAGIAAPHQSAYAAGAVYVQCTTRADGTSRLPTNAPAGARCAPGASGTTAAGPAPTRSGVPHSSAGTEHASATHTTEAAGQTPRPTATPLPTTRQAVPPPPRDADQLRSISLAVYGDSVPLGAVPELTGEFASVANHAVEGEQAWDLLPELNGDARSGALDGKVVLLHTGDNGLIPESQLRQALDALRGARRVIVATPHTPREWESHDVALLRSVVPDYGNTRLMDWNAAVTDRSSWLWSDGIHLTASGGQAYAHLVARAVTGRH
ncbi:acyltransferase family protein [Flexivirga endophytica]|uniref:acyltransferase family protein n=1 Tax=Flexivirga endophytica TaxID=1849103 RepID=UPI001668EC3E|nr:acyltransferase family protein [Flexivirga endophytica]